MRTKINQYFLFAFVFAIVLSFFSCEVLQEIESNLPVQSFGLTEEEIRDGLYDALEVGISNAVKQASVVDGFYKNDDIFVEFPMEAYKVREAALDFHLDAQVERFEETLNRAAEQAATEVKPVFLKALKEMSFQDAKQILHGDDDAATQYFKQKTYDELVEICYPKIESVTTQVQLTKHWEPIIKIYNKARLITGDPEINPDLNDYVTKKTIDGLFFLIENEEKQIREDPAKRITEIMKKVFGSL